MLFGAQVAQWPTKGSKGPKLSALLAFVIVTFMFDGGDSGSEITWYRTEPEAKDREREGEQR